MSSGSKENADEASHARPASPGAGLSPCGESAPAVPRLASYVDLEIPATRWVDMISDGGEWQPEAHIPMPHHHASRLELANLGDFPDLAAHRGGRIRLTVEITSREVRQVPGRREWRATYHARIVAACIPQ